MSCLSFYSEYCDPAFGEYTCGAYADLGCVFDANNGCISNVDCSAYTSLSSCDGAGANGCYWDEEGVCSIGDYLACGDPYDSAYYTCLATDYSTLISDLFAGTATDYTAVINEYVGRMLCKCLPVYFSCIFAGDCLSQYDELSSTCEVTMDSFETSYGITCPASSCSELGTTDTMSTITASFTFDTDPASWDTTTKSNFELAVEAEVTSLRAEWGTFDEAAGTYSVEIPAGTTTTIESLTEMEADFTTMADASIMASFNVASVEVQSELSSVSTYSSQVNPAEVAAVSLAACMLPLLM